MERNHIIKGQIKQFSKPEKKMLHIISINPYQ